MKEFETPEIEVVMFLSNDVISTSFGENYGGNEGGYEWEAIPSSPASQSDDLPF